MNNAIARIKGQIESLQEELRAIPPHRFNQQKIADRQRGLELCEAQLDRIERTHAAFLARRAELAARFYAAPRMAGPR